MATVPPVDDFESLASSMDSSCLTDPPLDAVEGVWIDESCGDACDEQAVYCWSTIPDEEYFAIERIRVARALEGLPVLLGGLEEGGVSWSAVRELTRVAVPETEAEWLNAVSGKTVREVERMVSGLEPGDLPGDVPKERARRHVLRFEVAAETYAAFREAERMIVEGLGPNQAHPAEARRRQGPAGKARRRRRSLRYGQEA